LTHCNTQQHAATRCNTLQHTGGHRARKGQHWIWQKQFATSYCNTLLHSAIHSNTPTHTGVEDANARFGTLITLGCGLISVCTYLRVAVCVAVCCIAVGCGPISVCTYLRVAVCCSMLHCGRVWSHFGLYVHIDVL